MSFGSRLKTLRIEKGLSQKQIAEEFGMSINCVSQYENDKRFPDEKMLVQLCEFYGVSSDYLLGLSDIKNPLHTYKIVLEQNLSAAQGEIIGKLIDMINEKSKENGDGTDNNI